MPILYTEYNNGKFKISAVVKKKIVCFIGVSNFSSRKFIENCNWNLVALVGGKVQNSVTLYTLTFIDLLIHIHDVYFHSRVNGRKIYSCLNSFTSVMNLFNLS